MPSKVKPEKVFSSLEAEQPLTGLGAGAGEQSSGKGDKRPRRNFIDKASLWRRRGAVLRVGPMLSFLSFDAISHTGARRRRRSYAENGRENICEILKFPKARRDAPRSRGDRNGRREGVPHPILREELK